MSLHHMIHAVVVRHAGVITFIILDLQFLPIIISTQIYDEALAKNRIENWTSHVFVMVIGGAYLLIPQLIL